MSKLNDYDAWLRDDGPAAVVIREPLTPVEGADGVFFPATFAAAEDRTKFAGGYNIDTFAGGENVCLVDSVGSQANRIEPMFLRDEYAALVPQIVINAGERSVSLLEAGHRAGDAIVRCTSLRPALQAAFKELQRGNAEPLAKIAPTSLVFGVWDSRDTQAKAPRLVSSTIRAYNVAPLRRSAQYIPAVNYVEEKVLEEPADSKTRDEYASRGFVHVPATGSHGGVIAAGGIRRDATLSLAALRLLTVRDEHGAVIVDRTLALRRYLLGLALTALSATPASYLRQGCNLTSDVEKPREVKLVHADGRREALSLSHADLLGFAQSAATAFGVGQNQAVEFDKARAKRDLAGEPTDGEPAPKKSKKK